VVIRAEDNVNAAILGRRGSWCLLRRVAALFVVSSGGGEFSDVNALRSRWLSVNVVGAPANEHHIVLFLSTRGIGVADQAHSRLP